MLQAMHEERLLLLRSAQSDGSPCLPKSYDKSIFGIEFSRSLILSAPALLLQAGAKAIRSHRPVSHGKGSATFYDR
jgi:hypothetical protein